MQPLAPQPRTSPLVWIVLALVACPLVFCGGCFGLMAIGSHVRPEKTAGRAKPDTKASVVVKVKPVNVSYEDPLATGKYYYLVLHLDITNRSNRDYQVNPMFGYSLEVDGVKHQAQEGSGLKDALELVTLAPGGHTSGNIVFTSNKPLTGKNFKMNDDQLLGPPVVFEVG